MRCLSIVKAGYRFSGAAAPCSGVQGMYKLHAAAFAQCILLPTLQNVGVKLLATFQLVKFLQNIALYISLAS